MGIHGGRPTLIGDGYVGVAVHTVARIMGLAKGGQILISRQAMVSIGKDRPTGVTFVDLGEQHLRGLGAHALFQVSAPDLPRA
jgi:class 3 adenylate cyclase